MKEGSAVIRVPGKENILIKGETAVINADTLHYIEGCGDYELESFVFSPSLAAPQSSVFFRKYISRIISSPLSLWVTSDNQTASFFLEAYEAEKKKECGYEFIVRDNLSKILITFYKENNLETPSHSPENRDTGRIEKMLLFIHAHYSEPITLSDIASASSISTREALRCFKRTINESPIRYLLKYRLMKSADILINERALSIKEVAAESGFDSQSYYSKEFRRFYGKSPGEYRKG